MYQGTWLSPPISCISLELSWISQEARMSADAAPSSKVPLPLISIEPPKLVITAAWLRF